MEIREHLLFFANHYLISHGGGFLVIPEKEVPEFKNLLVKYYEGEDISIISDFMKKNCWKLCSYKDGILYARVKIVDTFFSIPPIKGKKL